MMLATMLCIVMEYTNTSNDSQWLYGYYVMYSNGVMQYLQMILMIHDVGYYVMYSNGVMQYIQMLLMIHDVGYYYV